MALRSFLVLLLAAVALAVAAPIAGAGGSHGGHGAPAPAPAQSHADHASQPDSHVATAGTGPDKSTRVLVIGGFVAVNAGVMALAAFGRRRRPEARA